MRAFGAFFFRTAEEAPTTEFRRLVGNNPLVRCLKCGRTIDEHKDSVTDRIDQHDLPVPLTEASRHKHSVTDDTEDWLCCLSGGVFAMAGCDAKNPHAAVAWFASCCLAVLGFSFSSHSGVADNGIWQLVSWILACICVRIFAKCSQSKIRVITRFGVVTVAVVLCCFAFGWKPGSPAQNSLSQP